MSRAAAEQPYAGERLSFTEAVRSASAWDHSLTWLLFKHPMDHTFLPGEETWYPSDSPTSQFSAIFEDDGDTGYFYAGDRGRDEGSILDAVHIYNVRNVVDWEIDSKASIIWSADGLKAALLLNGYPHAVIDFEARRAYPRSNFPPPTGAWPAGERAPWNDGLMQLFGGIRA